jgi:hypothetical protein
MNSTEQARLHAVRQNAERLLIRRMEDLRAAAGARDLLEAAYDALEDAAKLAKIVDTLRAMDGVGG